MIAEQTQKVEGIGLATFNFTFPLTPQQRRPLVVNSDRVIIDWGDFGRNRWDQLFPSMSELRAIHLGLSNNDRPSILKQISHVNFSQLQVIKANRNRISSLEPVGKFCFPHLQQLDLVDNFIVSTRGLIKIVAPKLKKLQLKENPLCHNQRLFQANLPFLQQMVVSPFNEGEKNFKDPITWLVKLKGRVELPARSQRVIWTLRRPRNYPDINLYSKYQEALAHK